MPHTVTYERVEKYRQTGSGIVVPIALRASQNNETRLEAKIDTGAEHCIFERIYAESLDIEVEKGEPLRSQQSTALSMLSAMN